MTENTLYWLALTIFCIFAQGFYSMLEMASVSFNRVRLQYYVSKGVKRAIWLQYLLQKPSRLFGTVMLGVNIALQLGSQSSREFYRSLGFDPDLAPITQVFLVVILAELAPLFAARRYAEHVVMLGIPIVYATERLLSPLIWFIGFLSQCFNRLIGVKTQDVDTFLTREELQKVVESQEEGFGEKEEFNVIVANIFELKNKTAKDVMVNLEEIELIPFSTTVQQFRKQLTAHSAPYIPIYHKKRSNVVAMVFVRDLIPASDHQEVKDYSRPPWFITQDTQLVHILAQFRKNHQKVAVILNPQGLAVGILTLERILEEIFGTELPEKQEDYTTPVIERTFPGNMKIEDFNKEYKAHIHFEGVETFAQLMFIQLGHHPETGEFIIVDRFEITAEETSLLGIKTISIRSLET